MAMSKGQTSKGKVVASPSKSVQNKPTPKAPMKKMGGKMGKKGC